MESLTWPVSAKVVVDCVDKVEFPFRTARYAGALKALSIEYSDVCAGTVTCFSIKFHRLRFPRQGTIRGQV